MGFPLGFMGGRRPFFIGKTNGTGLTSSAGTHTTSHQVDANTTCLVCIAHFLDTGSPATSFVGATWNGVSLTSKVIAAPSTHDAAIGIFYLLNPTPATANGVVTLDGAIIRWFEAIWINLGGVVSVGVSGSDNSFTGDDLTVSITPTKPHVTVYGVAADFVSDSGTFSSGVTKESQIQNANGSTTFGWIRGQSGSLSKTYTMTSGYDDGAMVAASFY